MTDLAARAEETTTADPRPGRIARLVEALEAARLDAIVLTSLPNIRYLTGFSGTSAIVVVTLRREVLFLSDFRYQVQAAEEVGEVARIVIEPASLWAGLWRELPGLAGADLVGFESAQLLHRDFQRLLEQGSRWQWRPTTDLVEALRERKDAHEVGRIVEAARIATTALERTLPQLRAGLTEHQVAGILEKALRDAGSDGFPFPTIVASGPRSALPHARTSSRELRRGDFLLLDFGAVHDGYCSDVTRTVAIGAADGRMREVHGIVAEANALAREGVRGGMRGKDADALARRYIEDRGHGEAFGHSLGHGIGLEVHEAPRLARGADGALPMGAVVTIEPGVYLPGWGGVRIEDDVHLAPHGPELLTHFTRELLVVG